MKTKVNVKEVSQEELKNYFVISQEGLFLKSGKSKDFYNVEEGLDGAELFSLQEAENQKKESGGDIISFADALALEKDEYEIHC